MKLMKMGRRKRRRRNLIHSTKLNFIELRKKKRRRKKKKQKGVIRNDQSRKCKRRLEELCRRI